jgi:hypothetical protein
VTDHVHVEDAVGVELIDDSLGGNSDGRDKQGGLFGDDDVDQLAELALSVVVAGEESVAFRLDVGQVVLT